MEIRRWIHIIALCVCMIIVAAKDYYEILGVKRDATEKQIKRKFRELALKYHPDKNKDPRAEEQFRDIAEAYDTLGNAEKRRQYDLSGHHQSSNQGGSSDFHFNMRDFFKEFDEAAKFHFHQHQSHFGEDQRAHFEAHHRAHQQAHRKAHSSFFNFDFGALFEDIDGGNIGSEGGDINAFGFDNLFGGFGNAFGGNDIHIHTAGFSKESSKQNCKTITRREGNTVSTITECH